MLQEPLDAGFNVLVAAMANRLLPDGFDVSDDAPDTYEDLKAHYGCTGRILVSSLHCDRTIFGSEGGLYYNTSFRAWHDLCHLRSNKYRFTVLGEYQVAQEQVSDVHRVYGTGDYNYKPFTCLVRRATTLINCEINGQVAYVQRHGTFPVDQMAFAVAYLDNPARAISSTF